MQSSHVHQSYTQPRSTESFIRTATHSVPSSSHAPLNHARIFSRFFLSSLDRTTTGSAGGMRLNVTKASAAATNVDNSFNKLKTIPHSLYDDPAFSADPSSNPLCSSSHDINYWVTDPPKGHPTINSRSDHRNSFNNRQFIPIPPPNSPVSLHERQQASVSMIRPAATPNVSPPDLSSTASSASDLSLKTPGTSHSSLNVSQTSASSTGGNKKRIGLSFFKRRSNPEGTPTHRLVKQSKVPPSSQPAATKHVSSDSHSRPVLDGSGEAVRSAISGKKPAVLAAQSTRPLDMIDEMDESNPLGISLHHGGPYEAIQRFVGSNIYGPPRAPQKLEQPQRLSHNHPFRFDIPLNLSPGQVLPHSVTAYYRPQVPMDSAISFRDRLGLQSAISNQPVDQLQSPATNQKIGALMGQPGMAHLASNVTTGLTRYPSTHASPHNAALEQSLPLYHEQTDQTHVISGRDRPVDAAERVPQITPPIGGMGRLTIHGSSASVDHQVNESGEVTEESDDGVRIGEQLMTECQDTDDDDQGTVDSVSDEFDIHDSKPGDAHLPYVQDTEVQSRPHGLPRNTSPPPPYGPSRNTPPLHHELSGNTAHIPYGRTPPPPSVHLLPPTNYDPHNKDMPMRPLVDRRVYHIQSSAPSSNSSIQSGASSAMTSFTATSSTSYKSHSRILPRQLVMPAPLAKAAASSRPPPTHMPQFRDAQQQHFVRFHDGTEYQLPLTTSTQVKRTPSSVGTPSAHPAQTHTRTASIVRGGKLRKQNSLRGPEPPEIIARLAAAPQVRPSRKYMEPPPTIPEGPKLDGYTAKDPVKRLLGKRMSMY